MPYGIETFLNDKDISVGELIPKRISKGIDQASHSEGDKSVYQATVANKVSQKSVNTALHPSFAILWGRVRSPSNSMAL